MMSYQELMEGETFEINPSFIYNSHKKSRSIKKRTFRSVSRHRAMTCFGAIELLLVKEDRRTDILLSFCKMRGKRILRPSWITPKCPQHNISKRESNFSAIKLIQGETEAFCHVEFIQEPIGKFCTLTKAVIQNPYLVRNISIFTQV